MLSVTLGVKDITKALCHWAEVPPVNRIFLRWTKVDTLAFGDAKVESPYAGLLSGRKVAEMAGGNQGWRPIW